MGRRRLHVGKDFIGALFREVNLGATQLGSQETVQHQSQLEGFLEAEAEGESLNRECRTHSLPDPCPCGASWASGARGRVPRRVGGFLPCSAQPPTEGRKGRECPAAGEMDRTWGRCTGRMCLWENWEDRTRGGERKRRARRGLGGNADLGPQKPQATHSGNALHQESPALPAAAQDLWPHVQGRAGRGHIPRPSVGLAPSWPGLLPEPAGRGKILPK